MASLTAAFKLLAEVSGPFEASATLSETSVILSAAKDLAPSKQQAASSQHHRSPQHELTANKRPRCRPATPTESCKDSIIQPGVDCAAIYLGCRSPQRTQP